MINKIDKAITKSNRYKEKINQMIESLEESVIENDKKFNLYEKPEENSKSLMREIVKRQEEQHEEFKLEKHNDEQLFVQIKKERNKLTDKFVKDILALNYVENNPIDGAGVNITAKNPIYYMSLNNSDVLRSKIYDYLSKSVQSLNKKLNVFKLSVSDNSVIHVEYKNKDISYSSIILLEFVDKDYILNRLVENNDEYSDMSALSDMLEFYHISSTRVSKLLEKNKKIYEHIDMKGIEKAKSNRNYFGMEKINQSKRISILDNMRKRHQEIEKNNYAIENIRKNVKAIEDYGEAKLIEDAKKDVEKIHQFGLWISKDMSQEKGIEGNIRLENIEINGRSYEIKIKETSRVDTEEDLDKDSQFKNNTPPWW